MQAGETNVKRRLARPKGWSIIPKASRSRSHTPRESTVTDHHPLYLRGVESFNCQAYFQSHELWESLWGETEGPSRDYYKGLIQAAVALHHLAHGNMAGAQRLLDGCHEHLARYRPTYQGLDVDALLWQMDRCFAVAAGRTSARTNHLLADAPQIHLE